MRARRNSDAQARSTRPLLAGLGTIEGAVTDASTKSDIKGIEVCPFDVATEEEGECSITNAAGDYTLELPAGKYLIGFFDPIGGTLNYITQFYDGASTPEAATEVTVEAGIVRANVDAALEEGGRISGVVTAKATKEPVEGVVVCALEIEDEAFGCAETNAAGEYSVRGLPTGSYEVEFFAEQGNYLAQRVESVSVKVKKTTKLNAELLAGGEIEGKVTIAGTSTGASGVLVCALTAEELAEECAVTEPSGDYTIERLPTGSYRVGFAGLGVYETQYYDDKSSFGEAETVGVTAGGPPATAIDAAMQPLPPGGAIEGRVTVGETGVPASEVTVCAFDTSSEEGGCAETDAAGEYTITGLQSDSYVVFFEALGYPFEYYDQVFYASEEPTQVLVTAPVVRKNIDAELATLPKKTVAPTVTGTPSVGGVLTCQEGEYSATPAPSISVQWLRDGVEIAGATASTYTVQAADAGHQLQCKVTATNVAGWLWVTTAGILIPNPTPGGPITETPPSTGTSTSPATGSVLPFITVLPVVTAASHVVTSRHLGAVRLQCKGGACKGSLELTLRVVIHHHAETIVLATGSFSMQAGTSANVLMHLTSAGRSRLAHAARHPVAAKLKVSLHGGATTTRSVTAS
ncbi:MAG: carboxypeptidase regulatory-like domain-containing protein [Solirubrobacteraceae bacterium]